MGGEGRERVVKGLQERGKGKKKGERGKIQKDRERGERKEKNKKRDI